MSSISLALKHVHKRFQTQSKSISILEDISLTLNQGETVAIVGPSGSGKTTLLGICAGLDVPSEGSVYLMGKDLGQLKENEKAALRNEHVGFIFQNFQLIPTLTALDNIMVPLELRGDKQAKTKAIALLERVGLQHRSDHYPSQLSGGEQQRVAIARAFINAPSILFADEPTGNLDGDTGSGVEALLFDLNREKGTTLVIVTHDLDLAQKTSRMVRLKSGKIFQDVANEQTV